MSLRFLLLVSVAFFGAANGKPDEAKKKDLEKLQGEWKLMWAERDGQRYDAAQNILCIKGKKWGAKGQKEFASFEIDPNTSPKIIDVTSIQEGGKGQVTEGIYKIEGDMVITCLHVGEGVKQRPVEFSTKPGSNLIMYGWKRVEK